MTELTGSDSVTCKSPVDGTNRAHTIGAYVAPNTINFATVWAKFGSLHENAAVFSVVIASTALYVVLLVYARSADKKDLIKVKYYLPL